MKVLVIPRSPNPYQSLLYGALAKRGVHNRYVGEITPSHTVNLLSMPIELAFWRLLGYRILHIHWTYSFAWTFAESSQTLRQVSRVWFRLILVSCRVLGIKVVWTAHNLYPHEPVFDDDGRGRQHLAAASSAIICHSTAAAESIVCQKFGGPKPVVIPHGPYLAQNGALPDDVSRLLPVGSSSGHRVIGFVGSIHRYKGVHRLLLAYGQLPNSVPLSLSIAGSCEDTQLRGELRELVSHLDETKVRCTFSWLTDQELSSLLSSVDALCLPFEQITTSGSAILGLCAGLPLILQENVLPDLPQAACFRYPAEPAGLTRTLHKFAHMPEEDLAARGRAARAWATDITWDSCAIDTDMVYRRIGPRRTRSDAPVSSSSARA